MSLSKQVIPFTQSRRSRSWVYEAGDGLTGAGCRLVRGSKVALSLTLIHDRESEEVRMSGARFRAGERGWEWSFCGTNLTFLHILGAVAWFDPRLTSLFLYNLPHSPLHTEIKPRNLPWQNLAVSSQHSCFPRCSLPSGQSECLWLSLYNAVKSSFPMGVYPVGMSPEMPAL